MGWFFFLFFFTRWCSQEGGRRRCVEEKTKMVFDRWNQRDSWRWTVQLDGTRITNARIQSGIEARGGGAHEEGLPRREIDGPRFTECDTTETQRFDRDGERMGVDRDGEGVRFERDGERMRVERD